MASAFVLILTACDRSLPGSNDGRFGPFARPAPVGGRRSPNSPQSCGTLLEASLFCLLGTHIRVSWRNSWSIMRLGLPPFCCHPRSRLCSFVMMSSFPLFFVCVWYVFEHYEQQNLWVFYSQDGPSDFSRRSQRVTGRPEGQKKPISGIRVAHKEPECRVGSALAEGFRRGVSGHSAYRMSPGPSPA